jgi:hypothetical protein
MGLSIAILAYLGPETMLPMTSVVAGVAGVLMMFGRSSHRWVMRSLRAIAPGPMARPKTSRSPRRIGSGPVGGIVRGGTSRAMARD